MQVSHRNFLNTFTAVAALFVAGLWVDRAAGETADAPAGNAAILEEVIVTAQRREENLQKVPVAVSVFTTQALQQTGVATAQDLARVTPSFTSSSLLGTTDEISLGIRGQRTADERITNDGAVIAYVAEVPIARPVGVGTTGFLDLQSVQVVKGPVGTLFGRNTTGGAVLLTPNTPTDRFEGLGRVTLGNFGRVNGEGVLNLPLAEGVAFRIAITDGNRNGYVKNRAAFPDLDSEKYQGGRASFLFESGALKSIFYADGVHYSSSGGAGELTAVNPTGLANTIFPLGVGGGMIQALNEQNASNFWSARTATQTFDRSQVWGVSNTTTYALSDSVTLKNIVGYRYSRQQAHTDSGDSPYVVLQVSLPEYAKQFSEEPQVQYNGDRLQLIGGAFYFREKGWSGGYSNAFGPAGYSTDYDESAENISKSVFTEGTYSITDEFKLTLGTRYTWDHRSYSPSIHADFTQNLLASALGVVCLETDAAGLPLPGCRAFEHASYKKPTFNLTGQYELSRAEQVYASIRSGFRTGGFDVGSETAQQRIPYNPETVVNYELGFKGDFRPGETALRLNAAAYFSDYKNIQKSVVTCVGASPCALISRVENAAAATIKGIELELTWRLRDNVDLSGFYSHTNATYLRYSAVGPGGVPIDLSHQPFSELPANQAGATASYKIPVQGHDLLLVANESYQSWQNLSQDEAPQLGIRQGGYSLLNLRTELPLTSGMTVALWSHNVLDRRYNTSGANAYLTLGFASQYPGEPRTYGVDLSAKF
jgi:iron complex outermembrane receptor protein